jgi:small subunit ribosomal protein S21
VVEVKRRKGESFESLLRRFNRRVQQSGKLLEARKVRFHSKPPNKTKVRASALHRQAVKAKREYLLRAGQFVEEERPRGPKRM